MRSYHKQKQIFPQQTQKKFFFVIKWQIISQKIITIISSIRSHTHNNNNNIIFFLFHIIHYTLQFHLSFIFQSARRVDEGTLKMCINLFVNTAQSSRVENISDMMILKRKIYYSITSFVCDCVTVAFLFLFCSSIASPSQSNTIETQH